MMGGVAEGRANGELGRRKRRALGRDTMLYLFFCRSAPVRAALSLNDVERE